jgi:type I restriction enzyme S subunit
LWFNIGESVTDRNKNKPGYKKTKVGWIPNHWHCIFLSDVATIQTGLAKGKKNIKNPIKLPYLRVANVQDGFLDLGKIRKIQVEKNMVERYLLRNGDILFTEGGDFDKLGRGTIWRDEIPECLHQNHVFAVRCDTNKLLPYLLASIASSPYGRRYFLLSSKQSTNLASINAKQLKRFPLPLPSIIEQKNRQNPFHLGRCHQADPQAHRCQKASQKSPHAATAHRQKTVSGFWRTSFRRRPSS